jgi:hypothetical protein
MHAWGLMAFDEACNVDSIAEHKQQNVPQNPGEQIEWSTRCAMINLYHMLLHRERARDKRERERDTPWTPSFLAEEPGMLILQKPEAWDADLADEPPANPEEPAAADAAEEPGPDPIAEEPDPAAEELYASWYYICKRLCRGVDRHAHAMHA